MGLGIWSMHFTAMLAFNLAVPVTYHWPTVLLSLMIAMLASAVALYVVSRKKMRRLQAWWLSLVMTRMTMPSPHSFRIIWWAPSMNFFELLTMKQRSPRFMASITCRSKNRLFLYSRMTRFCTGTTGAL